MDLGWLWCDNVGSFLVKIMYHSGEWCWLWGYCTCVRAKEITVSSSQFCCKPINSSKKMFFFLKKKTEDVIHCKWILNFRVGSDIWERIRVIFVFENKKFALKFKVIFLRKSGWNSKNMLRLKSYLWWGYRYDYN